MSSAAAPEVSAASVLRAIAAAHRQALEEREPALIDAQVAEVNSKSEAEAEEASAERSLVEEDSNSEHRPGYPAVDEAQPALSPTPAPKKTTTVRGVVEEPAPAPAEDAMPAPRGWSASLLADEGGAKQILGRMAVGSGLAAVYGLAIGAREGGLSLLHHALGVPAALLAVIALGLPALYIVLSLLDAPLDARGALRAASRGIATAGLVLAGLAPAVALFVITSEEPSAAALAAGLGLLLGGALGLRHLGSSVVSALKETDSATRGLSILCLLGFGVFAVVLASRVWGALLPLLGGA